MGAAGPVGGVGVFVGGSVGGAVVVVVVVVEGVMEAREGERGRRGEDFCWGGFLLFFLLLVLLPESGVGVVSWGVAASGALVGAAAGFAGLLLLLRFLLFEAAAGRALLGLWRDWASDLGGWGAAGAGDSSLTGTGAGAGGGTGTGTWTGGTGTGAAGSSKSSWSTGSMSSEKRSSSVRPPNWSWSMAAVFDEG